MQVVNDEASHGVRAIFRPWYRGALYVAAFILAVVMLVMGGPGSLASQLAWAPLAIITVLALSWRQGRTTTDLFRTLTTKLHR